MNYDQFSRNMFDVGAKMARAQAELIAGGKPYLIVQSMEITPDGVGAAEPMRFTGCHGDVFFEGMLTITASETGLTVREFCPGEWLEATAYGPDGRMRYSIRPGTRHS